MIETIPPFRAHRRIDLSRRILASAARRAGFTIIELLVAVAIIIVLLSLLIVAMNAGARTGQKTRTAFLMNSIQQGVIQFKNEIGYFPPVLGVDPATNPNVQFYRRLVDYRGLNYTNNNNGGDDITPSNPTYAANVQKYYSITSIPEYLVGWAPHTEDGWGKLPPPATGINDWDKETPAAGIRHPGPDGVWGADTGLVGARMKYGNAAYGSETAPFEFDKGRVYGPYLELKDERLMGAINGTDAQGNPIIVFAGDVPNFELLPKVIVDYWGNPLRYYRRPYPPGALGQSYRSGVDYDGNGNAYDDHVPTLADIFLLRPYNVNNGAITDGLFPDANGDTTGTADLAAAEFAIFSAGADKRFNANVRNDAGYDGDGDGRKDDYNRDNIVQVGP